jgi:hypothetical protein
MTTAHADPPIALEESALEFAGEFMLHVSTAVGFGELRVPTIARVKTQLWAAITGSDDAATSAWRSLYATIADLVATSNDLRYTFASREYLRAFLEENADLAGD